MARVVHFEIMAKDPQRAAEFYTKIFGWQIQKWEGPEDYWVVTTGSKEQPGIDGGIGQSRGEALTVNVIDVESVDEMTARVEAGGGKVVLPKMAVPGVGWVAYCHDTEGIVFGMMQSDPAAK